MQGIHMAVFALGLLILICLVTMIVGDRVGSPTVAIGSGIVGLISIILFLISGWMALGPEYRLWRATIEKRILVEEARAQADAAVEQARAEVERAQGTAEANLIVADSITEPYLRYLYITGLNDTSNQVIYLPTEAGLPILEADRFRENEQPTD